MRHSGSLTDLRSIRSSVGAGLNRARTMVQKSRTMQKVKKRSKALLKKLQMHFGRVQQLTCQLLVVTFQSLEVVLSHLLLAVLWTKEGSTGDWQKTRRGQACLVRQRNVAGDLAILNLSHSAELNA